MNIEQRKKVRRVGAPEEAVFVDLMRTADTLSRPVTELLKTEDVSPPQYNVLRILRGSPNGLNCGEIGRRMITRDPDITRLLDRLEKRDLISRRRDDQKDRRIVSARITAQGLDLLARLDKPLQDLHVRLLGHLGAQRLGNLEELLAACRASD